MSMSEQDNRGDVNLEPKLDKPIIGYTLIEPDITLLQNTTDYLHKVQNSSHNGTAFIPTGLGMLIAPDGRQFIFSIYGAGPGNIYDMPSLDKPVSDIETSGVLICGVTTTSFEGYKLLTHAGGPDAVKILTNRALDLAKANGAKLQKPIDISLYCNPRDGYDTYVNGSKGYTPKIMELGQQMGLQLNVHQIPVSLETVIRK